VAVTECLAEPAAKSLFPSPLFHRPISLLPLLPPPPLTPFIPLILPPPVNFDTPHGRSNFLSHGPSPPPLPAPFRASESFPSCSVFPIFKPPFFFALFCSSPPSFRLCGFPAPEPPVPLSRPFHPAAEDHVHTNLQSFFCIFFVYAVSRWLAPPPYFFHAPPHSL